MAFKIVQQLVNRIDRVFGFNNRRLYITLHETDNYSRGAGAQAHANFQNNGGGGASWHYQVDDKIAIQSYSHSAQCFHAGDGAGNGNLNSIGVEICVNPDSDWETTKKNVVTLVRDIMRVEKISSTNVVVQHNYWSGKNCPRQLRLINNKQWNQLIQAIRNNTTLPPTTVKPAPAPAPGPLSLDAVAKKVINGDYGNGQTRIQKLANEGYDPIKVQARVNELLGNKQASVPAPAKPVLKSIETVAREVIAGKWGNGAARQTALTKAGYNYSTVQNTVNRILAGNKPVKSGPAKKSNEQLANEVIYGLWGNGADRQKRLSAAGYDYNAVQKIVNRKLL